MSIFILLLMLSAPAADITEWQRLSDPLSPARDGKVYCEGADHAAKTCSAMVEFRFAEDGSISDTTKAALNNDPPMSFAVNVSVSMKADQVCMILSQKELDGIEIFVGDKLFDDESANELLGFIKESMAKDFLGKELCEQHFAAGDRFKTITTIDGVEDTEVGEEYSWIDKSAGYSLATKHPLFAE